MRLFLIQAVILLAVVLVVAAVAFRSRAASEMLRTLLKAAWVYVALLFVLGGVEIVRRTLF